LLFGVKSQVIGSQTQVGRGSAPYLYGTWFGEITVMKNLVKAIRATLVPNASASAGEWRRTRAPSATKMAQLYCEAAAIGIDSSLVAVGSRGSIASALIGYGMTNAMERWIFVNRCLKAQGYDYVKSPARKKR